MSKHMLYQIGIVVMLAALLTACVAPVSAPAPAAATEAPAAEATAGKYYWVQNSAWHPVHQLTQLAFLDGCAEVGIECELATTDENSIEALVAVAEQTIARPDTKGVAMWFGGLPVAQPIIEKAKAAGIHVVLPHFPVEEGFYADNAVQIAADTTQYPDPVAKAMCDALAGQTGSVAVTQNNFNATEDMVAKVFTEGMNKYCPEITVLAPQLEGPEPTQAIAVAVSIMQANPDLIGALSTTGGGPSTWAGAQKETGKQIIAIGMDYTQVNLDLVKDGQIFGIVAQPLYEECKGAAELLAKMTAGEEVPYWTVLDAPLVTAGDVDTYQALLDTLAPRMRPTE
ncbi:MAG: substrate-binding domain-containing protein [Caldilineaceae bacterium]|nr:substrate-binding domain-containing protein [Caldilineaceae bacterium]